MTTPRTSVVLTLLTLSVVVRLVPWILALVGISMDPAHTSYPWNLSPLLPLCIFGGACFQQRRLAYIVPLATFLLGDLGIWALSGRLDWAFYAYQPLVYLCLALVASTGFALRGRHTWRGVATAGLASSVLYFVVTNFGVWAFGDGTVYPHTAAGLMDCYIRALPFFRNTLISMAVFLPLLFSRASLKTTTSAVGSHLTPLRGAR